MAYKEAWFRAFMCIDVPNTIKEDVLSLLPRFDRSEMGFMQLPQMHVTLFFFQRINPVQQRAIEDLMQALPSGKFAATISGISAFTEDNPRVLFASVQSPELAAIRDALRKGIDGLGIEIEDREFTPHLTIARVKRAGARTRAQIDELIEKNRHRELGGFMCDEIKLMKSTLGKNGPSHELLFTKILR